MLRRAVLRLAFSPVALKEFTTASQVSFSTITRQLGGLLEPPGAKLVVRSEPQSGKSSLLNYLQEKCTVFKQVDEGHVSGSALRPVDVEQSKAAAKRHGLGEHVVRRFAASESADWLRWAQQINQSDEAKCTVLLIDEASKMYGDAQFGDFFKSEFIGKAVFVATTSATTTLTTEASFHLPLYYMEPAFATRDELVEWFKHNLRVGWGNANGCSEAPFLDWVDHVAHAAISVCGGRVGIANFIGSELVYRPPGTRLLNLFANRSEEREIVTAVNEELLAALGRTRLLHYWPLSAGQQCAVVAAMLEGSLREELFDQNLAHHRELFPLCGLRLAPAKSSTLTSRYETEGMGLAQIHPDAGRYALTPVAPMCYASHFRKGLFPRYASVVEKMALMPVKVEEALNGLQLALRCLPHMNVTGLMCGDLVAESGQTSFLKGSAFPREVGAFQNAFKRAVTELFGSQLTFVPQEPTTGGAVDILVQLKSSGAVCGVEMLMESQAEELHSQLERHHRRWFTPEAHRNHYNNRGGGVTVAFVNNAEDVARAAVGWAWLGDVPLLLVEYSRCAFSWRCRLLLNQQVTSFTLDVDGVAMKLVGDGAEVAAALMPAQKMIGDLRRIRQLCDALNLYDISCCAVSVLDRTTGEVTDHNVERSWNTLTSSLIKALKHDDRGWEVLALDRFCQKKYVFRSSIFAALPVTTPEYPLEIVEKSCAMD